tara:strand:+ start:2730 stop:3119 length:390 start_codon:yes stop_codon:yes gene_type:complete
MIKPPNWCSNAIPGLNGWEDPQTGEVYASARFTDAQISEFYGYTPQIVEVLKHEAAFADFSEVYNETVEGKWDAAEASMVGEPDVVRFADLENMTKTELEVMGRENGVELDRRKSKSVLVETMKDILSK